MEDLLRYRVLTMEAAPPRRQTEVAERARVPLAARRPHAQATPTRIKLRNEQGRSFGIIRV